MEIRIATNEVVREYLSRPWPKAKPFRPASRVNMISSFDGKINLVQANGLPRELGLGSNLDKYLMQVLRTRADMVIWGAETLRVSNAKPLVSSPELLSLRKKEGLSASPIAAIVTQKGTDLPLEADFFTSPEFEAVIFVSSAAPKVNIKLLKATEREVVVFPENDFKFVAKAARTQFGVERLLIEGGPLLTDHFLKEGLVDEIYQTTAYKIVSGSNEEGIKSMTDGKGLAATEAKKLSPLSIYFVPETNELYQSVRVEN